MGARRAFTLVEVALAMSLVAVAVLSLFLVLPQGFKAQRTVRYQVLAAAKAMELVDLLHTSAPGRIHNARDHDKEGVYPWDGAATYSALRPDLESALESPFSVVKPLPEGIGRRFDSEGDEIARLLDAGGRLYYFYPSDPSGKMMVDPDLAADRNWFDATSSLIVGVVGGAQHNSILHYPALKAGPYQAFYPSPPTHAPTRVATVQRTHGLFSGGYSPLFCQDVVFDRGIGRVWMSETRYSWTDAGGATESRYFGAAEFLHRAELPDDSVRIGAETEDERRARRARTVGYLVPCLHFAEEVGLDPLGATALAAPPNDPADREGGYHPGVDPFDTYVEAHSGPGDGSKVLAMRYLAHAGMCLVACHRRAGELTAAGGFPLGGGVPGSDFPDLMGLLYEGEDWAPVTVDLDRIRAWHEASIRMAVRFADRAGPYDWGAPRPLNRQVMMDHPLVELDLWSPPVVDHFPFAHGSDHWDFPRERTYDPSQAFPPQVVLEGGRAMEQRRQWRALYASPITNPGRAAMYPGRVLDTSGDGALDDRDTPIPDWDGPAAGQPALGKPEHVTLLHPFEPAERTRELVFWAVDWQSYEDFESHPSAELDASRYPIMAPMPFDHALRSSHGAGLAAYRTFADGWLPSPWSKDRLGSEYGLVYSTFSSMPADHVWNRRSTHRRQVNVHGWASALPWSVRNPEHLAIFQLPSRRWDPVTASFTGAFYDEDRPVISELNDYGSGDETRWHGTNAAQQQAVDISTPNAPALDTAATADLFQHPQAYAWWNKFMNLGIYGANRDGRLSRRRVDLQTEYGRGVVGPTAGSSTSSRPSKDFATIDRGSVPATVRMHATTVARFVFYDPRISGGHFQ